MIPQIPKIIGGYAIEGVLGTGGMGVVVAGRHQVLGRRVALKLNFRADGGEDSDRLAERFRQGAILQAELDHPHIARVHDYLEQGRWQVIVMEFLAGGSIEEQIKAAEGPLAVDQALEMGVRAASALEYAHARGVIHRDIKPANLMLVYEGRPDTVRLTDFGVAKTLDRSPDLTMAGANVGTLWYMPPEQFNHEVPTPRADVYALGATIYEMLTGKIPFREAQHAELFKRFLDNEPPPPVRMRNPLVPEGLAAVVEQALALDPEIRVPSATAMSILLRAAAHLVGQGPERADERRAIDPEALAEARTVLPKLPGGGREEIERGLAGVESRIRRRIRDVPTRPDARPVSSWSGSMSGEEDEAATTLIGHLSDLQFDDDDDDRTVVMDRPDPLGDD